uniref:Uncharacterized protein n=1 Tax=Paramoeba aestuarina TaxID=180227 RepID=A0A7S4PEH2_9EUKA|mmetsp:Transcript_4895/g.7312  ORF Transcript_4895/g.7312 Transcript_4895/m.7312 type:complete len:242 (+) Transcript_4895:28-753(+)
MVILLCVDAYPWTDPRTSLGERQTELMYKVFRVDNLLPEEYPSRLVEFFQSKFLKTLDDAHDCCRWNDTQCNDEGEVVRVTWQGLSHIENLNYSWFPPSIVVLHVIRTGTVDAALRTRCLPPKLKYLTLRLCLIGGTVDLTALPENLVEIGLDMNHISGSINLMNLPPSLTTLRLNGNCISEIVYHLEKFPPNFRRASLQSQRFQKNTTKMTPRVIAFGKKKKDSRIYLEYKPPKGTYEMI